MLPCNLTWPQERPKTCNRKQTWRIVVPIMSHWHYIQSSHDRKNFQKRAPGSKNMQQETKLILNSTWWFINIKHPHQSSASTMRVNHVKPLQKAYKTWCWIRGRALRVHLCDRLCGSSVPEPWQWIICMKHPHQSSVSTTCVNHVKPLQKAYETWCWIIGRALRVHLCVRLCKTSVPESS